MNARTLVAVIALALALSELACQAGRSRRPPDLSGRWRALRIEWTQNERRVHLTADGEMHMGRFRLPQRPASFEPMIQAMQHVRVDVTQSGRDVRGSLHADSDAPASLLRQIDAQPGSTIAEFEGSLVNDTLGAVVVTVPDGRRRDVIIRIEDRGRRIVARAVPVFGETTEQASDVVLVRQLGPGTR
ncbi:MAG: hypothetical protein JSV41_07625 [Gemmatimonadota bacterium]|nr:MAG: hypothetical protein JSV41_07625 [Gemmatimonadota bacterium]